jgi:hypothetical protein
MEFRSDLLAAALSRYDFEDVDSVVEAIKEVLTR